MQLPTPTNLSLADALTRIARALRKRVVTDDVASVLHDALCTGKLDATGDFVDCDFKILSSGTPITADEWKSLPRDQFRQACYDRFVLALRPNAQAALAVYVTNVRIATAELDNWLCPPAKPNQAVFERSPRGPKSEILPRVISQMKADIESGKITAEGLNNKREKELETLYKASRDTVRKARDEVLNRNKKRGNSDK